MVTMRSYAKKQIPKIRSLLQITLATLISVGLLFARSNNINSGAIVEAATASELRAQARQLQTEIDANNKKITELKAHANDLQSKLSQLNAEISNVNNQIQLTTVKIAELEQELIKAQAELERQKGLLKAAMRALYKKGGASTVELLVASDSFSQFVNDQEYLERLKVAIQDSTQQVIRLKAQIQTQQEEQKVLLEQQKGQRDTLAAKQSEQRVLLETTRGEQARYKVATEQLRAQQAEINSQLFAASGGADYTATTSYPWANHTPWNFHGCWPDPWNMCKRHCVSYTAWKVAQSGRKMPDWSGRGNANEWDDNARAEGIPVDGNPKAGDIAISNAGVYGHAMHVDAVLADGRIHISQFNAESKGLYSEATINKGSLVFIHFPY